MTSLVSAHLRHLHDDQGLSWEQVRELYYPTVPRGTLCSIAKGTTPVPKKHRRALGLVGRRRERTEFEKHVSEMVRKTNKALKVTK
jgi:hypothetical protein